MLGESQVYQVARAVADGTGEWAEVPRCVREAVLLSLTTPHATSIDTPRRRTTAVPPDTPQGLGALPSTPLPPPLPAYLTEDMIERAIDTFEDANWVRGQAVRSFAQFHNYVETLQTSMGGHLFSLWHTAMALEPEFMANVRHGLRLHPQDPIPDGVPIDPAQELQIAAQEVLLRRLADAVQALREASVRFAAHFLNDVEKSKMGANPAYLRADVVEQSLQHRRRQEREQQRYHREAATEMFQRHGHHHPLSHPSSAAAARTTATPGRYDDLHRSSTHSSHRHHSSSPVKRPSGAPGPTHRSSPSSSPRKATAKMQHLARHRRSSGERDSCSRCSSCTSISSSSSTRHRLGRQDSCSQRAAPSTRTGAGPSSGPTRTTSLRRRPSATADNGNTVLPAGKRVVVVRSVERGKDADQEWRDENYRGRRLRTGRAEESGDGFAATRRSRRCPATPEGGGAASDASSQAETKTKGADRFVDEATAKHFLRRLDHLNRQTMR